MSGHTTSSGSAEPPGNDVPKLPTEVLLRILEITSETSSHDQSLFPDPWTEAALDVETFRALALVDRRFNALTTPFLYRNPAPTPRLFSTMGEKIYINRLHRTLKGRLALRRLVKSIQLSLDQAELWPRKETDQLHEIISWITEADTILIKPSITPCDREPFWKPVCRVIDGMEGLKHFSMTGSDGMLDTMDLVASIGYSPMLQKLHMRDISGFDGHCLLINEECTSPITHLEIVNSPSPPAVVQRLLRWPKALQAFKYQECDAPYTGKIALSLPVLWRELVEYSATLETLELGFLEKATPPHPHQPDLPSPPSELDAEEWAAFSAISDSEIIDLSSFTALRSLSLSRRSFPCTGLTFDEGARAGLLVPRLESFIWTFEHRGKSDDTLSCIGPEEEAWLRDFGVCAVERKHSRLRDIFVEYEPAAEIASWVEDTARVAEYPWDRLRRVADDLRPHGVQLSYPKPNCTREKWEEIVLEWKTEWESVAI